MLFPKKDLGPEIFRRIMSMSTGLRLHTESFSLDTPYTAILMGRCFAVRRECNRALLQENNER